MCFADSFLFKSPPSATPGFRQHNIEDRMSTDQHHPRVQRTMYTIDGILGLKADPSCRQDKEIKEQKEIKTGK